MWGRIFDEFVTLLQCDTTRNAIALMNRWSIIQKFVNKFSGYEQNVDRNPVSGYGSHDDVSYVFHVGCQNITAKNQSLRKERSSTGAQHSKLLFKYQVGT